VPSQRDGEGKIQFPGGISIFINRVGPGVFFALFGAGVVALSLYHGIVYFREGPTDKTYAAKASDPETVYYGGMTQRQPSAVNTADNQRRRRLRLEVEFLNRLSSFIKADIDDTDRRFIMDRSRSIKLALMETAWGKDWGDYENFQLWVESGGDSPVPKGLEQAAAYYRFGQEDTQ
jgi:hypothetical protein